MAASASTSVFMAKLIGPFFLALGAGLLVNGDCYRDITREFLNSKSLICLAGVISLPAGLAIVLTHNVWTLDWRVLITIIGWLSIAAGAFRMVAPQQAADFGRSKADNPLLIKIGGAIWLVVGALLCFFGYLR